MPPRLFFQSSFSLRQHPRKRHLIWIYSGAGTLLWEYRQYYPFTFPFYDSSIKACDSNQSLSVLRWIHCNLDMLSFGLSGFIVKTCWISQIYRDAIYRTRSHWMYRNILDTLCILRSHIRAMEFAWIKISDTAWFSVFPINNSIGNELWSVTFQYSVSVSNWFLGKFMALRNILPIYWGWLH